MNETDRQIVEMEFRLQGDTFPGYVAPTPGYDPLPTDSWTNQTLDYARSVWQEGVARTAMQGTTLDYTIPEQDWNLTNSRAYRAWDVNNLPNTTITTTDTAYLELVAQMYDFQNTHRIWNADNINYSRSTHTDIVYYGTGGGTTVTNADFEEVMMMLSAASIYGATTTTNIKSKYHKYPLQVRENMLSVVTKHGIYSKEFKNKTEKTHDISNAERLFFVGWTYTKI